MKKLAIVLALCLMMFVVTAVPVLAAAQKVDLVLCPINYPTGGDVGALNGTAPPPGGGFVVFNNSAGTNHNLEVTVSLKGVMPNTAYDIYLFTDNAWYAGAKAGTVTTNGQGNANFHMNGLVDKGTHYLAIDVTYEGSLADVYETTGIHGSPYGIPMTFK
jgi:hypothetical protein